jgi:hypothetical protein
MANLLRSLRLPLCLLAAVASTACFSSETVIRVKADGSGTIEQTNLANTMMLGMAAGMAQGAAKDNPDAAALGNLNLNGLFDEATLRQQAAALGPGVRFVSSEKLAQGGMQGAKALYSFDDVRTLTMGGARNVSADTAAKVPGPDLRFELTPSANGTSTLRINFPAPQRAGADDTPAAPTRELPKDIPPEALTMIKSMFAGARVAIAVDVDGRIVSTDAPAHSGSRATLFAIDFEQLLSDPSRLSMLQTLKPGADLDRVRKALEGVPGVHVPASQTVTIQFAR